MVVGTAFPGLVVETVGIFPEMAGAAADRKGGSPPTQALPHRGRHEDLRELAE
jgi:hypothetical protein